MGYDRSCRRGSDSVPLGVVVAKGAAVVLPTPGSTMYGLNASETCGGDGMDA